MTAPAWVSTYEASLLGVARALTTPDAYPTIEPILLGAADPEPIGPTAMRLLEDTLAKGVVKMLARLGGAEPRIRPDTGTLVRKRVFEARAPLKLAFGPFTFELVRWLATAPLTFGDRLARVPFQEEATTLGDRLIAYLALRLVEGERVEGFVAMQLGLRCDLTWLGYARTLGVCSVLGGSKKPAVVPSFDALLATEDGRTVLECLSADLARRVRSDALWNEDVVATADDAMLLATTERAVLAAFTERAIATDRAYLATFLVDAGARLLPRDVRSTTIAARVVPRVGEGGTLRARTESRKRSGALFHALGLLAQKREELALLRFFEDGYDVAQATLQSWEPLGREGFQRADAVVAALSALEEPTAANAGP